MSKSFFYLIIIFIIFTGLPRIEAELSSGYPVANISTIWINNNHTLQTICTINNLSYYCDEEYYEPDYHIKVRFYYRIKVRIILFHKDVAAPSFACGFFCIDPCDGFIFAMFSPCSFGEPYCMKIVWSANQNQLVQENATIELTNDGNLLLREVDDSVVWSTGTSGKSVVSMNITKSGNLVLFDRQNHPVWQSFEHPTDTLVTGQVLKEGQDLTSNNSTTNLAQEQFSFTLVRYGQSANLQAYILSNPPQMYFSDYKDNVSSGSLYMTISNGSLNINGGEWKKVNSTASFQYISLESDGHLRIYEWAYDGWNLVGDVLTLDICDYPTTCGKYGVCTSGHCSCPHIVLKNSSLFQQVNYSQPNLGCYPVNVLSCESMQDHQLIALTDTSYFNYADYVTTTLLYIDDDSCRQACFNICSCKAALFTFYHEVSSGFCYLISELFTVKSIQPWVSNSSVFIKVQSTYAVQSTSYTVEKTKRSYKVILFSVLGGSFILLFAIGLTVLLTRKTVMEDEDEIDEVPGMPKRFTLKELKIATLNFTKKLGKGGFGSVYEGKINDEMVAVKCLDGVGQGKREFLAEVLTVGKLHHINLVRLVGFCVEKSQKFLVYEFMPNGSLDQWIFCKDRNLAALNWQTRCKIISDIARGLSYLHEECRQRIAHLDIKPQNILLDENFNAKVSDFGLAKLIDRDQKQVMTGMRGTPGYLAPEWLTSIITEKVDIYSFGVVIMEIVCGRKNLDYSQPEENNHLITLLQNRIQANQPFDIVDRRGIDMELNRDEVMKMIKLAIHCLQIDVNKRPSMSTVVKVLEGAMIIQTEPDYNLVANILVKEDQQTETYAQTASLLSAPRC